ncbi:MAG: SH3 domain-containing protein [Anaerolineaceae bacterium]|nr:SH3 domain-containing protein [Anaerolineaceae bacterium]MCY3905777.1 SH3 domain-containing protein [Anaerolineaceae bacterium]
MSRKARHVLLLVALLSGACNLTTERPQPTSLPPAVATASASKPEVSISAPLDGAEVVVGTDILIRGQASDAQGVTRVQLVANDRIVRTVSSESPAGNRSMPITLDYRPVVTGRLELEVVAWRGNVAGDPTGVTLEVRANRSGVLTTAVPLPEVPVIDPNDPTCRVLINGPLNVRVNAGIVYRRITTLASGDQVPVLARLVDDSWWQVRLRDGTVGWVAGHNPDNASEQFVSVFGDCTNIQALPPPEPEAPTAAPGDPAPTSAAPEQPPAAPQENTGNGGNGEGSDRADLIVANLRGPVTLTLERGSSSVSATYEVTVSNRGAAASGGFHVRLGGIPDSDPLVEVVGGLGPGESISFSHEVAFSADESVVLVATVDSNDEVSEGDEGNNSTRLEVTVSRN